LGFRPTEPGERTARLRRGLVVSAMLLVIISIPLGIVFVQSAQESRLRLAINETLIREVESNPQFELLDFTFDQVDHQVDVTVRIYAQETPSATQVNAWGDQLSQVLGQPVQLHLESIAMSKIESSAP
jgi:hypothetical protein